MTVAPGHQIGTYTIEGTLGSGGMGVVYVGVDARLGRRAAIKQLLPALSSDHAIVERFFNEAKAAASINHPSIIEIYDFGWHTDGSAYFAMKLLEGESVGRRMRTTRGLPIERRSRGRSRRHSARRTRAGSSTATSSPTTSCWSATTRS